MVETSDLAGYTDKELLQHLNNSPGSPFHEAAKTYLQLRIANRTEASSKRLEVATWVILGTTILQLVLFIVQIVRGH